MELLSYAGIPAVVLIIGISSMLTNLGVNKKIIPIINLILGLGAGIALNFPDIMQGVFVGLAVGLSASGLYSGVKNTMEMNK
jgi:hypothetical protein